ncbi:thioredoxin domain-containing protein [Caldivirga sp. UBA161]|uniref:thioredoxin domain-containing protein n=1 Tax=Caldivirga sp. UBA161 TaxID=1915569 RepID=UPI0025C5FEF6|nr:thioredoxin domain-containing protein [Caldivirga sp. UBA161]
MNNKVIIIIVAVVVAAVAIVLVTSALGIIPLSIPGLSFSKSLPSNGFVYVIGAYPNVPTLVRDVVYGNPIHGLGSSEGIGSLTPSAVEYISKLIKNGNDYIITYGNPKAPVWLLEFLDPVCPYCTIFDVYNFSQIAPLIKSGRVYYIVVYFPTHALGYYQAYEQQPNATVLLQAFNDSVALWLQWKCVNSINATQTLNAINETYIADLMYGLIPYVEYNNQAYLIYYPIFSYNLLNSTYYPECKVTLNPLQAVNITNNALSQVNNIIPLLIPKNLQSNVGTPMFIIMRNPGN